jgi:hypothetical protein
MGALGFIETAGELLSASSELAWAGRLLAECAGGELREHGPSGATVEVRVERSRRAFDTRGWPRLGRDAWRHDGEVVVRDACRSGFDVHIRCDPTLSRFTFRWRPPLLTRSAALALPVRARLLARAALLHFPAMWWAGTRGRAPVHAPAVRVGDATFLLAGHSGVGKTTFIQGKTGRGFAATGDNLSVTDGRTVWGVVEPMRSVGGRGRRMTYGRREASMAGRVSALVPDRIVVLRGDMESRVAAVDPQAAERALVTGTYMAGELRRYWPFTALLAAGTGLGPSHPPVAEAARELSARLPAIEAGLPDLDGDGFEHLTAISPAGRWR